MKILNLIEGGIFPAPIQYMKSTKHPGPPVPILTELPPPPFELSALAQRIYVEKGRYLVGLEFLKASDLDALATYANEMATYILCSREVNRQHETGQPNEGFVVQLHNKVTAPNMYRKLAETALKNALVLADRLGLNPGQRRKMGGYDETSIKAEKEHWERRSKYG